MYSQKVRKVRKFFIKKVGNLGTCYNPEKNYATNESLVCSI